MPLQTPAVAVTDATAVVQPLPHACRIWASRLANGYPQMIYVLIRLSRTKTHLLLLCPKQPLALALDMDASDTRQLEGLHRPLAGHSAGGAPLSQALHVDLRLDSRELTAACACLTHLAPTRPGAILKQRLHNNLHYDYKGWSQALLHVTGAGSTKPQQSV